MSANTPQRTISVADAMEAMNAHRYKQAIEICDEILEQMPDNATAICVREHCMWRRGADPKACLAGLQRALDLAPSSPLVRTYMAQILTSAGELEQARNLLNEALDTDPENVNAFHELAEITKFTEETELLRRMGALHDKGGLPPEHMEVLGFGLAKAYADIKQPDLAMRYVTAANLVAKRDFDMPKLVARRADLEEYADSVMPTKPDASDATVADGPIFIVGMPRSGTTLVETILSRHPDVHAAGEMGTMMAIELQVNKWLREQRGIDLGPHTMLDEVPPDVWTQNAARVGEIAQRQTDRKFRWFTDKMPDNTRRLPLIGRVFPGARIIYVRRHPLDCCLSCLFKRFVTLPYAFQQDWLGKVYRDMTETMTLSRKLIPNPVLDLSYEALVADPDNQVRRLINFVGLNWRDEFLSPEKSERSTVMTASRWQVRQPMYRTATARWEPYAPFLTEMIDAMGGMGWIESEVAEAALATLK